MSRLLVHIIDGKKKHAISNSTMHSALYTIVATSLVMSSSFAAELGKLTVKLDTSKAPECAEFAAKAEKIAVEWYPKIHELIFEKEQTLPDKTIQITIEPMDGVAYAQGPHIHISSAWLKKSPNDYGMIVHELVHIVQSYNGKGEFWLTEGIADFVRYHHYEPGKQNWAFNPQSSSYKQGYGIAGDFLQWLDTSKKPGVIKTLSTACHKGEYKSEMITKECGADVDALWKEYVSTKTKKK